MHHPLTQITTHKRTRPQPLRKTHITVPSRLPRPTHRADSGCLSRCVSDLVGAPEITARACAVGSAEEFRIGYKVIHMALEEFPEKLPAGTFDIQGRLVGALGAGESCPV